VTDITELMNRDPVDLTDEHIEQIIEEYRKKRHLFQSTPAGPKPKRAPKVSEATKKLNLDIDL
jgi:hypothetical protein